jgi:hypothetical protein
MELKLDLDADGAATDQGQVVLAALAALARHMSPHVAGRLWQFHPAVGGHLVSFNRQQD